MTERRRLLAPQLEKSEVWTDYADSIDAVFASVGIEDARTKLALLRSPLNLQDVVTAVDGGTLTALDSVERQERVTLVKTADMLGFRFYDSTILNVEDYLRLCIFISQYYDEDKGTERFDDFMGFMANVALEVKSTWTEDYVTFYAEGDPAIGTPVYQGGTWYPTTHVILSFGLDKFTGVDRQNLLDFFYYFANINVVLWAIEMTDDVLIQQGICGAATYEVWL